MSHITLPASSSEIRFTLSRAVSASCTALSTAGTMVIQCGKALLRMGAAIGKAFEMLYVEPYRPALRDDWSKPENF